MTIPLWIRCPLAAVRSSVSAFGSRRDGPMSGAWGAASRVDPERLMETNRTSRTFNTQQYSVDDDTSVERMRTAQPKATSMASELVPFFADQSSPVALRPRVRADGASCDRVATLGCFLSARQKEIVRRLGDRQGLSNEEDKEIIDADQEALNEAIRQSLELDRSIRSAIPERSPDQWMNRNTSGPLQSDESNQETRDTLQPRLEPASASTASRPSAQQREAGAGSRHDAALQPNAGTYNTSGVNAGAGEHNPIRKWVFGEERISPPRQARAKPQAGITQTKPLPPQPNAQQQALAKSSRSDNQW
ncbi:hypothetical protein DFQ30_010226, partial [Apophysomyces sp. BC1015]